MSNKSKKGGLGKGLDGLLIDKTSNTDKKADITDKEANPDVTIRAGTPLMVKIGLIKPNPDQPRKYFNAKEMESLTESIRDKGIIEPLIVSITQDGYELIAGHRRLIAAKTAELKEVPVIIKQLSGDISERLELALIENIIREKLNPIEESEAFQRLEKEFGKKDLQIARLTGKDRSTIINSIRLLDLTDDIKDDIRFNRLTPGHGRAILAIANKDKWPEARSLIISKNLTVRQAESMAKKFNVPTTKAKDDKNEANQAYYESLEKSFSDSLGGFKVSIKYKGKAKKIEISYKTNEDMELLMKKFGVTGG
jgi:ParB family chromosome partitioning protein